MPDSPFTDAITYSQPLMKEISDDNAKRAFLDPNLSQILLILRDTNKPMTVDELEESFKAIDQEKSPKTIYRYLKKLEEAELVVQAGKRVFSKDVKKLRTKTLYMRAAKLFFPIKTPYEVKHQKKEIVNVIGELLEKASTRKLKSPDKLNDFIADLFIRESELVRNTLKNTDEKQAKTIANWDIKQRQSAIAIIGRLVLYQDEIDWNKKFEECFE
ncbi:MAG: ArsR family transcriptional regulator [Candidatus Hodarchaeota archaeon]